MRPYDGGVDGMSPARQPHGKRKVVEETGGTRGDCGPPRRQRAVGEDRIYCRSQSQNKTKRAV